MILLLLRPFSPRGMGAPAQSTRYRFGLFEADPASGELLRQGVRVRLQDLPFRMLIHLLERPGEVVSREELREKLWPADTYVEFDSSVRAALKRLRAALGDSGENPIFIETLPKRGYRFMVPVAIEDEPVGAEADSLPEPPVPVQTTAPEVIVSLEPRGWQRRGLIYAAALAVVLAAVLGWWYSIRHRSRPVQSSLSNPGQSIPVRKSVAVLGFHNASGRANDEWLATAISEMLSTELATGEKLRVVSGEEVGSLRISSPWSQASTLGRETAIRIGTALNSDLLVLGSYTALGPADHSQLRFDVRLQDGRTGEVLNQIAQTGNVNDLFQFASEIGARLRQRLGVPEINNTEQAGVLASLPLDRDGARFYALGVAKLREFDVLAAKDLLEQATKTDPKFSLAHLMLARAWAQLGYEQRRKEEAKKALDLSIDLPRTERMQVEGDYYESLPDHEKAASTYRALFALFPDNVEYGLQLAAAQKAAGHDSQAQQTIAELRRLQPPASEDPRIDLAEERAVPVNFAVQLELAQRAMHKAQTQGKKLLYAQAEQIDCHDLSYSDHPEQAEPYCEDSYSLFLAAGNRLAAAESMRLLGDMQGTLGRLNQAIATYQKALRILAQLGEHEKTGSVLNNMAINFTNEGNLDRGEQLYREAKSHFEQAGDQRNTAVTISNIADILYLRGKLLAAEKSYRKTIEIENARDRGVPAYAQYRLADLKLTEGRVAEAYKLAQGAVEALRAAQGSYQYLTPAMNVLGDVLKAEGNLEKAHQQYQLALDIGKKAGEPVAETQVELSELALEVGHPDQAEPLLRAAIAEFEKEKADPDSISAYIELSRMLLMEGKLQDARTAIQHAAELGRTSPDPGLKLPIAIQSARVMLAAVRQNERGHPTLAAVRQQLRSVSDSAKRLGYYGQECESRLALGELEVKENPKLARFLLTQLVADAHQHGMERIARQATALAASTNATLMAVTPSLPR
ncbi:MAG TPA: tetratricopeptide repeat protein [Terriglobales bacterium]|nr:tetratricopeptide repeat protein [Terriglobales bacterium]